MPTDPVREEAERLVAAAIAAVSLAARGLGGAAVFGQRRTAGAGSQGTAAEGPAEHGYTGFATGSAECCVCPVCRVIAAMRDPSPDLAERLASGAGELATGVTGLLRAFGRGAPDRRTEEPGGGWAGPEDEPRDGFSPSEDAWHTATTMPAAPPKPMAKKAVKKAVPKAVKKAAAPPPADASSATEPRARKATTKAAKKTARKAAKPPAPPKGAGG